MGVEGVKGSFPGMPRARHLTRPLSHSPEPGDEGEPGRSGLELEPEEPPGWRELVPQDILHSLPRSQVKRQEVISGEFHPLQPTAAKDTARLWQRQTWGDGHLGVTYTRA